MNGVSRRLEYIRQDLVRYLAMYWGACQQTGYWARFHFVNCSSMSQRRHRNWRFGDAFFFGSTWRVRLGWTRLRRRRYLTRCRWNEWLFAYGGRGLRRI